MACEGLPWVWGKVELAEKQPVAELELANVKQIQLHYD